MYRIKEPAESITTEEVGIVLLNHVGSSCTEDSGRDAQFLADYFGLQVIATNRPGSGWMPPSKALANEITHDYKAAIAKVGQELAGEVEARNFKRLVVTGRSAGGLGALALASTDELPVTHVYAAEPVGWLKTTVDQGKGRYYRYNALQKALLADDKSKLLYIHPDPSPLKGLSKLRRYASIPCHFQIDSFHNKRLWASSAAYDFAFFIGKKLTSIDTTIAFAQESLVAPQPLVEQVIEELPTIRTEGSPFVIEQLPYTVHASFDKQSFMATRLATVVHRALAS